MTTTKALIVWNIILTLAIIAGVEHHHQQQEAINFLFSELEAIICN
jgi:hypothetical protein